MRALRLDWLRIVSLLLLVAAASAHAQDPRGTAANAAAREWLAIVDRGDVAASYAAAGAKFRSVLTDQQWAAIHAKERKPRGALKARALFQTALNAKIPQAQGPGDYVLLGYRTSYENQPDARETVTLERESDGAWRVIGYSVR